MAVLTLLTQVLLTNLVAFQNRIVHSAIKRYTLQSPTLQPVPNTKKSPRICCFFRLNGRLKAELSIWYHLRARAHWMASESADPALSPGVSSFVICEKTWKLGDEIYSTGVGVMHIKEMVHNFGNAYCTARVEGVFSQVGRGSGQKYRVKWTNLSVWNGPTFQKNWFVSTVLITDSFMIRPRNGLKKCQKFMVPLPGDLYIPIADSNVLD